MADDEGTLTGRRDVDEDEVCLVQKLPADLLVRVCRYLSVRERQRLRCVCKMFRQVLDNALLWKAVAIDGFQSSDYALLNAVLSGRESTVERVCISGSFNLAGLARDLCSCNGLRSLKLEQSPCYVTNMASVVRALPLLSRLEFQPVNTSCGLGHCTHVMCRAMEWQDFLKAVQNLSSLTLLSQWDENFVEFLLRQWACIKYRPSNICMSTIHTQTEQSADSMQFRYSSLQDLWRECMESFPPCEDPCQFRVTWQASRLGPNDIPVFELNLDGSPLSLSTALSYTRPETTEFVVSMHGVLSLSGQEQIEEDEERFRCGRFISNPEFVLSEMETRFHQFDAATAHLTSVTLTDASSLNPSNLEMLAHHCKNLTLLNLSGCKKCLNPLFGLAALTTNCTRLQAFNIQNIPCNYVERTSEMWMCLSQMKSLRHLAIDPCLLQASQEADEFTGEQYSISDESEIEASLKAMAFVQSLEVQTTLTTDKSIQCPHCRNMDGHLMRLVGHMRALHTLHIKGVSPVVCDNLLRTTTAKCQYLRNLSINMEFSFTLLSAEVSLQNLRKLFIRCPRFSLTDSLTCALVQAPLTHVYFTLRHISKGSMTMLLQELPQLAVCHVYCRDGPVMKPPGSILEFRHSMLDMVSAGPRLMPLDFVFNEGSLYSSQVECTTTQSLAQTELVSWWN